MLCRTYALVMIAFALSMLDAADAAATTVQRTFVASTGNDANPCSLVAPCRSFNTAIANTLSGGEVVILDTAGYGPMIIDKAIKIIGPSGVYGGISVLGGGGGITTGIVINAGDNDVVVLRGLDVSGVPGLAPLPVHGIDIQNAGAVHIEKTSISNFSQSVSACINIQPVRVIPIYVTDSYLRECRHGVFIIGGSSLEIDNIRMERMLNTESIGCTGVDAQEGAQVVLRNSTITSTASQCTGVVAYNDIGGSTTSVSIINSTITQTVKAIATSGSANVLVNVVNSQFHQNFIVLGHGFGTVNLQGSLISSNNFSLANCGSGNVTSLGTTLITSNADLVPPSGCSLISATSIVVGK